MLFWIFYFILLLVGETLFVLRTASQLRVWSKLAKRKELAPDVLLPGHPIRQTKADLQPACERAALDAISWVAIAAVGVYAMLDCFVFYIMR